jgi:uncharacterized protein YcbX
MPYLSQIYIYPIKSVTGIPVEQWEVTKTGLKYDRQWMLVDEQHQFLSQRRLAKMALIKPRLKDEQIIVSAPGKPDISIPLHPAEYKANDAVTVTVWHDQCFAKLISEKVDQWFSEFLEQPCHLVYQPSNSIRTVDQQYALSVDQTSFSDGFPFLIASEASLALLNQQVGLTLEMQRFRPNLVIADCASYAEDTWRTIQVGDIAFRLPKPCSRCPVPQIDPKTAIMGKEPLRTMARTRKWKNKVFFGQNALHDSEGILQTGDTVIIKKTGTAQPPLETGA